MSYKPSYNMEPRALYVYSLAHIPNVVPLDMSEKMEMFREFLGMMSELIKFATYTLKRLNLFQVLEWEKESANFRKFSPTMWTLRSFSL